MKNLRHPRIKIVAWLLALILIALFPRSVSGKSAFTASHIETPWRLTCTLSKGVMPNEGGKVPILEYHNISWAKKLSTYEYSSVDFKQDMEWLYSHNFRPINLSDYASGWIDVPSGTTPFVITFDDALSGQFDCRADGTIDPRCAVGILEQLHTEHPDWPLKATFFVLTNIGSGLPPPFTAPGIPGGVHQGQFAAMKMKFLVDQGFEIGNHTLHHSMKLHFMPPKLVEAEFFGGACGIRRYLPGYRVQTLALPYGIYPADTALVVGGSTASGTYHNICAVEAGCKPAPSPMSVNFAPYEIPRIIPRNNRLAPGARFTIRYWLNHLELFPAERFISDGDPTTYTVPFQEANDLDFSRLKIQHYKIKLYRGTKAVVYND